VSDAAERTPPAARPSGGGRAPLQWLALPLVLLLGCPNPPPPPDLGPMLAPAEALRRVTERRDAVRSFRGKVSIDLAVSGESLSTDAALVVERPSSLRLDTLSLLGPTLMLAIDDTELTAYSAGDKQFFRGTVHDGAAPARVLPPMPTSVLIDALLASPLDPGTEGIEAKPAEDTPGTFDVAIPASGASGARRLAIDARTGAPRTLEETGLDGQLRYRASWEGAERPVPRSITIEVPSHDFRVRISVESPDVNPALPSGLFHLKAPPGATVVDLDSPSAPILQ